MERARASKKARVASHTAEESLDGLEPVASDWHAEANFLQVNIIIVMTSIQVLPFTWNQLHVKTYRICIVYRPFF